MKCQHSLVEVKTSGDGKLSQYKARTCALDHSSANINSLSLSPPPPTPHPLSPSISNNIRIPVFEKSWPGYDILPHEKSIQTNLNAEKPNVVKNPGKVRARTNGTKSPSRSEALRFIDSAKSPYRWGFG